MVYFEGEERSTGWLLDAVFSRRVARQVRYEHEWAIYCGGGVWYSQAGRRAVQGQQTRGARGWQVSRGSRGGVESEHAQARIHTRTSGAEGLA